jgi:hypothetical protein
LEKRNWKIGVTILCVAVIVLGIFLGLCKSRPDDILVVGKVWQNNYHGGSQEALDSWDFPLTDCRVVLRYAGAEGTADLSGGQSPWSIYFSNGRIVSEAQVDEDGVYSFNLNWDPPEGVFKGGIDQDVEVVIYQVEVLTSVQGFYRQVMIGPDQVRLTKDTKIIQGPQILLFR